MTSLQSLQLFNNELTGSLPPSWGNMTRLQSLDLSRNELNETLPPSWSAMINVQYLYLYQNELTGSLPPSWVGMMKLREMHLYNNQLTGSLPHSWVNMTSLRLLLLNSNQLTGSLPPSLGTIIALDVATNQLTGTLPLSWGNMTNVMDLYLQNNQLTGSLPPTWGSMTSLQNLNLCNNQITGSLPISWGNLTSLQSFNLTSNYLRYSIPSGWLQRFATYALTSNCLDPPASNQRPTWKCRFSLSSSFTQENTQTLAAGSDSRASMSDVTLSHTPTWSLGGSSLSNSLTRPFFVSTTTTTALNTVNMATIASMTTALFGGRGGATTAGLSSLQGAVGAMRLAYRCNSENVGDVTSTPDPSAESSDNPLGLVLHTLPSDLAAVGGSIVGNLALIAVIALTAHALVKLRDIRPWNAPLVPPCSCTHLQRSVLCRCSFVAASG